MEEVDTTFATLDNSRMRNVNVEANTFNGVNQVTMNPVSLEFDVSSFQSVWTCDFSGFLPFGGNARRATSLIFEDEIRDSSFNTQSGMPYALTEQGANGDQITLNWPSASRGTVFLTARMDNPT